MELRHLQYLVAVVDEGGFTRAAELLHVAQPGISAQIRQLERELGQQLLDRSGRGVRLTAAGEAVLPYARAALAAASGVRQAIDQLTGLMTGTLTVGTVASFAAPRFGLPRHMADFHLQHPGIVLTLTEAPADTLLDGLRTGRLDVVFLGHSSLPDEGFTAEPVWSDEIVAVGAGLPRPLPVSALEGRAIYAFPGWTSVGAAFAKACSAASFRPEIVFETTAPQVLTELAGRTGGVAVLPASAAPEPTSFDPPLHSMIVVARRAGLPPSPAARAFLTHIATVRDPDL